MSVTFAQGLRNCTTLYTGLRSGIGTGRSGTRPVLLAAHGARRRVRSSKPSDTIYPDTEESRIYNDFAGRIQNRVEELESEKSRRRDCRIAKP